jgi:hypothetical protein
LLPRVGLALDQAEFVAVYVFELYPHSPRAPGKRPIRSSTRRDHRCEACKDAHVSPGGAPVIRRNVREKRYGLRERS